MEITPTEKEKKYFILLILLSFVVYISGWFIPLMEIDAAQYANISREMLLNKSFLQVFDRGQDYLDKPPMLFWLSALSMKLFGINDIAYRLPSFLFAVLSIFSTYRLALLFYKEQIALISALVLASCQAMFLITHDVRTDTMLMGWVIFSIWQLSLWFRTKKWKHLIAASISVAGGLLTKGPIALMVPIFSFVPHFLLQRSFRQFFRWQHLVALVIIGICLIPMCIGLYYQYDLHPEKVMYGQHGISGLRFYFWTQSFGRITGESTWHENDSFFFLFENMLWGFLPWIIFFVCGLLNDCIVLARGRFILALDQEWITDGGFIVTYCALGMSRAQLPHYIYIVLPLAAIITGKWLYKLLYTNSFKCLVKPLLVIHVVIFSLLTIALFLLLALPFPPVNTTLIIFAILVFLLFVIIFIKKWIPLPSLLVVAVYTILFVNFFLDTGFYRLLLQYQMSVKVSSIIKQKAIDKRRLFVYKLNEERSLHFYSNHFFRRVNNADSLSVNDCLLTSQQGYDSLDKNKYRIIYAGESFHVSRLTLQFLNPASRKKETDPYFILKRF